MSERIHALAYHLFGKASVDECDLEEVKQLAIKYPYFAPAQFLLLQKLKENGSEEYGAQLQKAVLYHHNLLEFEYFINSDRFYTDISFDKKEVVTPDETFTETETLQPAQEQGTATEEIPVEEQTSFAIDDQPSSVEAIESSSPFEVPAVSETFHAETEQAIEDIEVALPERSNQETQLIIQETNVSSEPQTPNPKLQTLNPSEAALTFEPFHTVDYFASQGIKLSQEEAGKDKFGKQLKSFTEWLRSMKRIPAPEAQKPETPSEKKVQHLAEDSINKADVVTEAMAEVWQKQGNREKAIETYNKLSLLNPSKKAYFAAKIDNLKHS